MLWECQKDLRQHGLSYLLLLLLLLLLRLLLMPLLLLDYV